MNIMHLAGIATLLATRNDGFDAFYRSTILCRNISFRLVGSSWSTIEFGVITPYSSSTR